MKKDKNIQHKTNEHISDEEGGGIGRFLIYFGGFIAAGILISLLVNYLTH